MYINHSIVSYFTSVRQRRRKAILPVLPCLYPAILFPFTLHNTEFRQQFVCVILRIKYLGEMFSQSEVNT